MRQYHNELLWIVFSVVAVVAFMLFHPVFMLKWNKAAAHEKASAWLEQVKAAQIVNAAEWWEFRATYAPGTFEYNPEKLAVFSILQLQNLSLTEPNELFAYTTEEEKLTSVEYLVTQSQVEKIRLEFYLQPASVDWIVVQPDTLVGLRDGQTILWMNRPLDEMKQVNGLINYEDPDKVLERNNWRWITVAEWTQ
jgi:hypothetical protein